MLLWPLKHVGVFYPVMSQQLMVEDNVGAAAENFDLGSKENLIFHRDVFYQVESWLRKVIKESETGPLTQSLS